MNFVDVRDAGDRLAGLASMAGIERLTRPDAAKLEGAITGRALYDGRIDAKAALALLNGASTGAPA
jgi:phosphoribosylformimino-5-aminoimidazole carboxamide ribotide isomerase